METPLLTKFTDDKQLLDVDGDYHSITGLKELWKVFRIETVKLWIIGGPISFNILCTFGVNIVTNVFAGHIGDLELSGIALANSVIGTFCFGFLLGMGSALETLCGQAYGAGKVQVLGLYLQRSIIILFVACIVLTPLYVFAAPLLKVLGQEDDIANVAGLFSILTLPQLFSMSITFTTLKFLQAQSKVAITVWSGIITLLLHFFFLWLFVVRLGLGIVGAAITHDISSWGGALVQFIYIIGWCKDAWTGWTVAAFSDLWAFVRLSLASAIMLCLEVWYMMSITILTGHLKNAVIAVGSLTICMNLNGLECMIFVGINAAISVRVSNELGLGRPRATKYCVYVTVLQSILVGIAFMVVVIAARNHIGALFSDSTEMHHAVARLAGLLGVTMLLNSVQAVISGVAVGGGWQALVAYINLGCYYVFGLPLGFALGYAAKLGVKGLWGGMIAGTALQTLLLVVVLYRTNWSDEVAQTNERMKIWGGQEIDAKATSKENEA